MLSPEHMTQVLHNLIPPLAAMEFRVEAADDGRVRTSMPLQPNHNHLGSLYAGSLFSMAETSGGALILSMARSTDLIVMVKDVSMEYHRLALTDIHCELAVPEDFWPTIDAQLEREGKAFYRLPVPLFDAEGVKVATAWLNYRFKPKAVDS